jgi:3-phosphoshikimate 1-carboxyvinyltransferase
MRGIFIEIPGDVSSAAFWIAAALAVPESAIEFRNVSLNATRTGFIDVLQRMGGSIETVLRRSEPEPVGTIRVQTSSLRGITLSANDVPSLVDELPLLAVLATQAEGTTVVRGAAELRIKESDRIEAIAAVLRAMGAEIETFHDGFAVSGRQTLRGATIDPAGDHRIAMAGAIAALVARGDSLVQHAECVGVSYPGFFSTLASLGATVQS